VKTFHYFHKTSMINVGEGVGGIKKTSCRESSWSCVLRFHYGIRADFYL